MRTYSLAVVGCLMSATIRSAPAQAARIEGDVYVMKVGVMLRDGATVSDNDGSIQRAVGVPVFLIQLDNRKRRALTAFCGDFLHEGELPFSDDLKWSLARQLRSIAHPIAETETGVDAHYQFNSVQPGSYAVLAESENLMWWKDIVVRAGDHVQAHLNNRVAYAFSMDLRFRRVPHFVRPADWQCDQVICLSGQPPSTVSMDISRGMLITATGSPFAGFRREQASAGRRLTSA